MSSNNLRIIYQNLVEVATTLTASSNASASTPVSNLALERKAKIWRSRTFSTSAVKAVIIAAFPSSYEIGGVILPFTNLSTSATMRVRGYTGSIPTHTGTAEVPTVGTPGTTVFDTGTIVAAPYQIPEIWNWANLPLGANSYSYGGGTYGRVWIPTPTSCTSISIEIVDTKTEKYLEASSLVIGKYWSPIYNTSYGLSTTMEDMSKHSRSEAGDLITTRGPRFNSLTFDLKWLTVTDRVELINIMKGNGISRPLFISLFPNNSEDWSKEQAHQIYGKLSDLSAIIHHVLAMYNTKIDIQEI